MYAVTKDTQPLIHALLKHTQRWEYIELDIPELLVQVFAPARRRMPLLQQLQLCLAGPEHFDTDMMIDVFAVAPQLQSVVLHIHTSSLQLLWEQLTECRLSVSIYAILEFLRQTPGLANCVLDDCFWGYNIGEPVPDFPRTSNLLSLHLTQTMRTSGIFIFQYVTLPCLHDIAIDIWDKAEWPQEDFMDFISWSVCPLERLALLRVTLTLQELTECFQALPSLLELEIDRVYTIKGEGHKSILNDQLLLRLIHRAEIDQAILLPRLQIIKLTGLLHCHDYNLEDMIKSQWCQLSLSVSRLKSVHLKYHREWDTEVMSRLEQFAAQGLHLSVIQVAVDI